MTEVTTMDAAIPYRSYPSLPELCRQPEASEITQRGRTAFYKDMKEGLLPPPIYLGERARAWIVDELNQVMQARIAGQSKDEIRALVAKLVDARQTAA